MLTNPPDIAAAHPTYEEHVAANAKFSKLGYEKVEDMLNGEYGLEPGEIALAEDWLRIAVTNEEIEHAKNEANAIFSKTRFRKCRDHNQPQRSS